jgi:hypothetical protein
MTHEKDFLAPLEPDLLTAFAFGNHNVSFEESGDVWALGITTLCFIFNEDFNSYYDWTKKTIRKEKIDACLATLYNMQYDQRVIRLLGEMLDKDQVARASLDRIYSIIHQKGY